MLEDGRVVLFSRRHWDWDLEKCLVGQNPPSRPPPRAALMQGSRGRKLASSRASQKYIQPAVDIHVLEANANNPSSSALILVDLVLDPESQPPAEQHAGQQWLVHQMDRLPTTPCRNMFTDRAGR